MTLPYTILAAVSQHELTPWLGGKFYDIPVIQGGSNMTGTDLYVNKPHCAAAVRPW